ncbi:MAG TPA: chromate resistance protein ChrB domain-containing protein [Gemmatimonadaceae bacterium]|nr:chromate resistance protein ChrB domain-containing protein [Gemmatimonadaceae bacterium]
MNDSFTSSGQVEPVGARWLLLIHQLPPKPDYLRVKVRRRLKGIGAVPVKHTVYLLPNTSEALEDFHWLREEIEADGGSAIIAEATFVEGLSDEEVEAMLESERGEAIDADSERRVGADTVGAGRTWVTRKDVHVDRIASAWLIRRFIDRDAHFKFVASRGYKPDASELRFDMFEAEYTHVGEACTFQTLSRRFGIGERAITAIGEIVHDIDCKDERFGRAETAGIASLIRGIVDTHEDDAVRIERGLALFDDLHASFRKRRG